MLTQRVSLYEVEAQDCADHSTVTEFLVEQGLMEDVCDPVPEVTLYVVAYVYGSDLYLDELEAEQAASATNQAWAEMED